VTHNVSKVFYFAGSKGTFCVFDKQLVVLQQVKDLVHMKKVAILSEALNEDVIKENQYKIMKVRFQYFIHETLEDEWSIAKVKRHDQ
jgi:hypothetical protein